MNNISFYNITIDAFNKQVLACDIIPAFYNSKTNKPYETCIYCDEILENAGTYLVQKSFKINELTGDYDIEAEFAMCEKCNELLSKELSNESKLALMTYMSNMRYSDSRNCSSYENDLLSNMQTCAKHNKIWNSYKEYTIVGLFSEQYLIIEGLPLLIGEKAILEMNDLLSDKSRRLNDHFVKDIINPPEYENDPTKPILIF